MGIYRKRPKRYQNHKPQKNSRMAKRKEEENLELNNRCKQEGKKKQDSCIRRTKSEELKGAELRVVICGK